MVYLGVKMNNRIKELWELATFDESRIVDGIYHPYIALQFAGEPGRYSITEEQRAKFAELIVKECIDITSGLSKLFPRTDVSFDVGYTMGTTRATKEIKEHFGIEE